MEYVKAIKSVVAGSFRNQDRSGVCRKRCVEKCEGRFLGFVWFTLVPYG
jgi:hypothetical protein